MNSIFDWDTGGGEGGTPPMGREIIAGLGLTGGGDLSADVTIDVGAGNGIEVDANEVCVRLATVSGLSFDSGLQIDDAVAGDGLGIASKVLSVGAGNGITVAASSVAVRLKASGGLSFDTGEVQIDDMICGAGLTITSKVLAVGAGLGITVNYSNVALTTPGTLTVSSTNDSTGSHTHAITSSANPGVGASLLASDARGILKLVELDTDTIGNKTAATDLSISSTGDITFDPAGNDILPVTNYDLNLGSLSKKYLTLHAAELWVETLVAEDTIATIGGHILVAPTTVLVEDISATQTQLCLNPGFETLGAGGADVFANWTESAGNGTITNDTTYKHSGSRSCRLTAGASFNTLVNQTYVATAGEGYTISFWVRNSNALYPGRYGLYDVTHGGWIVALTTAPASTTFVQITFTGLVPAGCTSVALYFECPGANTYYTSFDDVLWYADYIKVKHNEIVGEDIVYLQANGKIEFMRVISPNGVVSASYTYYVQRDLDGTGTNDWFSGDAVLNTGTTGDGYLDVYSDHSIKGATEYGPTIEGVIRTGIVYNNLVEAWAIGNLNGLYGIGVDTYGAAFGKFLTGEQILKINPTDGIWMGTYDGGSNWTQRIAIGTDDKIIIGDQAVASTSRIEISAGVINFINRTAVPADVTQLSISTAGVIVVGAVANSKSRIEINAGAINLIARSAGGADTTNMTLSTAGVVTVGQVANSQARVEISSGAISIISRSAGAADSTLIKLDTNGALFGLTGASKANSFFNLTNSRLEFRTNTTANSWIDTDGAFVVKTAGAIGRVNGVTFYNGTADIGYLSGYNAAGYHSIGLKALSVAAEVGEIELIAIAPTTYAAEVIISAASAAELCKIEIISDDNATVKNSINFTTDKVIFYSPAVLQIYGNVNMVRDGVDQYLPTFVPLTIPRASTSFDGDLKSTTAKTLIDLSTAPAAGFGLPAGIKAVLVYYYITDTGSAATDCYLVLSANNTAGQGVKASPYPVNSRAGRGILIVPCDANGDIYYQIVASGASSFAIGLEIDGYWI